MSREFSILCAVTCVLSLAKAAEGIIGAEGKEFESANSAWSLFPGDGEGPISLIVLRGGQRMELSLERIPMDGIWLESLGGMLTPVIHE